MRKKGKIVFLTGVVILFGIMLGVGYFAKKNQVSQDTPYAAYVAGNNETVQFTQNNMNIQVQYGLQGSIRYGRYMQILTVIRNHGKSFSGTIQAQLPGEDVSYCYQKAFSVDEDDMSRVLLVFPANMFKSRLRLSILNEKDNAICEKQVDLEVGYGEDMTYIGVLSDQQDKLKYLEKTDNKVFYLEDSELSSDYKALDVLDVLVVSDKDMSQLSKGKIQAIVQWVKRGGTLVLADSGEEKELAPFAGKFFNWDRENCREVATSFGLESEDIDIVRQRIEKELRAKRAKSVEQFLRNNLSKRIYDKWQYVISHLEQDSSCLDEDEEIYSYLRERFSGSSLKSNLSLELGKRELQELSESIKITKVKKWMTSLYVWNSKKLLMNDWDQTVLQLVDCGIGNVLVYGCSLTLPEEQWNILGGQIGIQISDSLSATKKHQLYRERNQDYTEQAYECQRGLMVTETDSLPNLVLYGIILVLYLGLIIILCVLFRRKRHKTVYLWGIIPAIAVLFTFLIYILGTTTRITSPYVNYLSQLTLGNDGQGQVETWFRLTNGDSKDYRTELAGNCDVIPMSYGSFQTNQQDESKNVSSSFPRSQSVISYGSNRTSILLENLSSLEGVNFCSREMVEIDGEIVSNITSNEMQLSGIVKNSLNLDMEDCFLYDNGTVYWLGELKAGENVFLDNISSSDIYKQTEYDYDSDSLVNKLFGTNSWNARGMADCTKQRRAALVEGYLYNVAAYSTFIYGFVADRQIPQNTFINKMEYDRYGTMSITKALPVKYTANGVEMLPDISEYAVTYDSSVTDGKIIKNNSRKRIEVSYQLPDGYEWKGLTYNQNNNAEFSYYNTGYLSSAMFSGTVTMIDKTHEIEIIKSGEPTEMELDPEDVGENGILTLYYYLDTSVDAELQLPDIMVSVMRKKPVAQSEAGTEKSKEESVILSK